MIEATLKKKAGQAGNADAHPYLRADRLEIRVSPHEKHRIVQNSIDNGFDSVAQFVREQAMHAGKAANPNAQRQALLACQYQLNRMGNNLNQIARHLNQGAKPDDEILLTLMQIQEHAAMLLNLAQTQNGGRS